MAEGERGRAGTGAARKARGDRATAVRGRRGGADGGEASHPGRPVDKLRQAVVEPAFGKIQAAQGFRKFLLRGQEKVQAEGKRTCATHHRVQLLRLG